MGSLRDYQRAILEAMLDGNEHSREELVEVGARACSTEHALAMYQRTQRQPHRDRAGHTLDFTGLTTAQRLQKIAQQEVLGARLQSSKAVSHLEDRGLLETVTYIKVGGRQVRSSFRITDLGRERLAYDSRPKDGPNGKTDRSEASRKAYATRRARHGEEGIQEQSERARRTREERYDTRELTERANQTKKERGIAAAAGKKAAETRRKRYGNSSEIAKKGWETRRKRESPEEISRKAQENSKKMSSEERAELSRKGWETRRKTGADKAAVEKQKKTIAEKGTHSEAGKRSWETRRRNLMRTRGVGTLSTEDFYKKYDQLLGVESDAQ